MARTFTIPANEQQEAALDWILSVRNTERAAQGQPVLTLDELVGGWAQGVLDDYVRQQKAADKAAVEAAMDDPVKSAAIKAAAGL